MIIYGLATPVLANGKTQDLPVVFVPNVFNTIDPVKIRKAQDSFVSGLIYETLFQVNSESEVIPALLKGWKYDSSKNEITISLHSDHRFYDGSYVQAKDVVESLKQLCLHQPLHLSSLLAGIVGCRSETWLQAHIKELDTTTLAIEISSTPSAFLHQLSSVGAAIFKNGKNGLVGSGPYHGKMLSEGNMELVRNPFYHDPTSIKNKGILFIYRPGKDTRQNLMRYQPAGSVMLLSNLGGKYNIESYYKYTHVPYVTQTLVINPNKYPLNNVELRKAIQADIYNQGKLHECGSSAERSYGFIPNGIGGSFVDLPDLLSIESPSKSLSNLLKRLKKKPAQLKIYSHFDRKSECEASKIKKIFKKYNIITEFEYCPDYKKLANHRKNDDTQAYIELFAFILRDSAKMLNRFSFNKKKNKNMFYWSNQKIHQLMAKAAQKVSLRERFPLYRKVNEIIFNNANVIDLYYVGQTNYFHHCYEIAQPKLSFNPNAFYLLKTLKRVKDCVIK